MADEQHVDVIRSWLDGRLSSDELFSHIQPMFNIAIRGVSDIDHDLIRRFSVIALDAVRSEESNVQQWTNKRVVHHLIQTLRAQVPPLDDQLTRLRNVRAERHARLIAEAKAAKRRRLHQTRLMQLAAALASGKSRVFSSPSFLTPPRVEPEHERIDVYASFEDIASLIERVDEADHALVRLLALRVLAGWSLNEIARRDGVSIDELSTEWARARNLLVQPVTAPVGSIITFSLLDLHILHTLLRDRSLATALDWRTFERVLAGLLERFGYEIELQRGTKDGGIDILAIKRETIFGPHRYLVQAKRWRNNVGVEPVRELLFLRQHYGATKACLATTSSFTRGALELANEYQWCLELRDYERLLEWIELAFPAMSHLRS